MRLRFALYMSVAGKHVLTGWKEIAIYLQRGVRTVQRWEVELGLPVRRPAGNGNDRSAVIAMVNELDQWLKSSPLRAKQRQLMSVHPRPGRPTSDCKRLIAEAYQLQTQIWQSSLELAAATEQLKTTIARFASQPQPERLQHERPRHRRHEQPYKLGFARRG